MENITYALNEWTLYELSWKEKKRKTNFSSFCNRTVGRLSNEGRIDIIPGTFSCCYLSRHVSYSPVKFGGHRHRVSGYMILVSKDHVIKGLFDFTCGSPSW